METIEVKIDLDALAMRVEARLQDRARLEGISPEWPLEIAAEAERFRLQLTRSS